MTDTKQHVRKFLYLLFAISGFSGLIYESIWSHYLKLFLGHAAYAQTLVLAIFMGGMAVGAWLPSRYATRWKNLLLWYAVAEGAVGICAVAFHALFVAATSFSYDTVIPALGSAWSVTLFKWSLSAFLIIPQSILLGTTFPLMSAGLIRRYPSNPGESLAMLYFTNSLGAAIGVVVSGFVLIEWVGLPGTILSAGFLNIGLALIVWTLARNITEPTAPRLARKDARRRGMPVPWRLMIAASFFTGCASFVYEIGWIRMLSLVLGSSTHAFELMLSAFIFGLALGGFWIRRRIDVVVQPIRYLGWIQVTMGILALGTLAAYNGSFDIMKLFMDALARSEKGYILFNFASHSIALLIMLPVTFCAGMTLPLITHTLLRGEHGEKSIGAVYAANTAGAIVGVFFAVHIGLPILGLKGAIVTGAALDMALGVALLGTPEKRWNWRAARTGMALAAFAVAVALLDVQLDPYKMASGVYRNGNFYAPASIEILFHKDGKTATVDLLKDAKGAVEVATNGKSDATINMAPDSPASADESTMIMAAAVPLLLHPEARTVANIGMGSGLTTHVLLGDPNLQRVDTIEIEPAMIEAAHGFRPRVERTFSDPRSHFYVDDAKTFFSAHRRRYDIIVSEPSNPWVSGVASLFSDEFYRRARTYLNPNGLFVQWMQLYEIDFDLVASVMKAVARNFSDYALFTPNNVDLLIVATKDGRIPSLIADPSSQPELARSLARIDIHSLGDMKLRGLGDRALFEPMFASSSAPMNSDFFPVLDLNAVRTRFTNSGGTDLTALGAVSLPLLEMLSGDPSGAVVAHPTPAPNLLRARKAFVAGVVRGLMESKASTPGNILDAVLARHLLLVRALSRNCENPMAASSWLDSVTNVMDSIVPYLEPTELDSLWRHLRTARCYRYLSPVQRRVFALLGAVARRDGPQMGVLAEKLLVSPGLPNSQDKYLVSAGMLGYLAAKKPEEALRLWKTYGDRVASAGPNLMIRLLVTQSLRRDYEQRVRQAALKSPATKIQ